MTTETYHSLDQLADAASQGQLPTPGGKFASLDKSALNDALDLARYGWTDHQDETLDIARDAVEAATRDAELQTASPVWDVTGAMVDVGAFCSGVPECMVDFPQWPVSTQGRIVTLVVSCSFSSAVSSETILKRGQAATAFALALSQLGYACEIWTDMSLNSRSGKHDRRIRVQVKAASDTLDAAKLTYSLCHASYLRTLMFAVMNRWPVSVQKGIGAGRGWPASPKAGSDPDGTLYLPEILSSSDVPDAHTALLSLLRDAGLIEQG